jgi:hypothetical protein
MIASVDHFDTRKAIARAVLSRSRRGVGREARAFLRRCATNEKPLRGKQHRRFAKLAQLVGIQWSVQP